MSSLFNILCSCRSRTNYFLKPSVYTAELCIFKWHDMMVQGELRFTLLPFSWKGRVFASSMICLLLPAGSDLPSLHPVRRSQTSDRGDPSRSHGPCAALYHPCRDWPHQPQSPAIARLPARRGLPQLTLRRGKCMVTAKLVCVFRINREPATFHMDRCVFRYLCRSLSRYVIRCLKSDIKNLLVVDIHITHTQTTIIWWRDLFLLTDLGKMWFTDQNIFNVHLVRVR